MRDDERAARRRLGAQEPRELDLALRVDTACRLVEHEEVGIRDEHGGERQPLALARREVARMPVGVVGQTKLRERCAGALLVGAERDLVDDALCDEVTAGVLREIRGALPRRLAVLRLEQAGGDLRERRLADAVRPDERDDLAAPYLDRRVVEHDAVAVGEANAADACDDVGRVRQVERAMLREPLQRLLARRVQHDAAAVHEEHAVTTGERPRRPLFRDEHGARQVLDQVEERLRRFGIELRRRLVEQQEPRVQRERGRERHALQLAPRQLRGQASPELLGADERERLVDPRPDLARGHARVLEPERDLVQHLGHHDLVLRVLEHGRDGPSELCRAHLARVDPADDDAPREDTAVEVRHEPRERTKQRRLPRSRRAEQRNVLALFDLQRHAVEHRRAGGVGEAQVVDDR